MTLTMEDLNAIGVLLEEKLDKKLEEKLDSKLEAGLEKLEEKLDSKLEAGLEKLEEKLDKKLDSKLDEKLDSKLQPVMNRLEILEFKQDRTSKKLDDLQLDIKIFERDVRRDIYTLKDEMATVVEVLKMNELIPQ